MPLPANKEEAIQALMTSYEKLDAEYDALNNRNSRRKEIPDGISPCDILAYQIGWGKLLLKWEASEKTGRKYEMPEKGYKWNQLGKLARSFYATHKGATLEELRAEYRKVVRRISKLIEGMDGDELFEIQQRDWAGEKWPVIKWIQVNTIAPYKSARTKLRKWKRENDLN